MICPFHLQWRPKQAFRLAASLAVLLLTSNPAFAQQSNAAKDAAPIVEGKVSDPAGNPVREAILRLEPEKPGSSENLASARATTDEEGKFVLEAPNAGRYTLRVAADAFATLVMNNVTLAAAERRHIDVTLQVARGGGPVVEASATNPTIPPVQLSDEPNFTVAGITDRSNMGLHGSDANVRTSDALAKETAALKSNARGKGATAGAGDAHRLAGDAKERSGDPLAAVKEYEAAVKADPSEQNYFAWGAELLLHRAGQAAVQVFSKGAKAHPDSARMLAGLGVAYYSNGQSKEAAVQLCRASDLAPADSAPYLFLGKMEQAAADPFACSETALSRFAANQPADPQANFFYGLVLWKKARKTQDAAGLVHAEKLFKKALQLDPHLAEVYLQLGMLYNARGERNAALAAFQEAVSADPKSSQAHYQLSLAYRRSGNVGKADAEMRTYDELHRSEDAAVGKERREFRQFVTILQEGKSGRP
jgi:tetratricopeptide (TPR) repeat protein